MQSLLFNLAEPAHRIAVLERLGKHMRQLNSIETAKEVEKFTIKMNSKKKIDEYPV